MQESASLQARDQTDLGPRSSQAEETGGSLHTEEQGLHLYLLGVQVISGMPHKFYSTPTMRCPWAAWVGAHCHCLPPVQHACIYYSNPVPQGTAYSEICLKN